MLTIIITGAKGRRSAESRGGPKAGGGVQGGDGVSDKNCVLTGGSREAEGDRRGMEADGARAAGRDAGAGVGRYGHARWWNAGTIVSSSSANAKGMQEVHGPPAGAQGVCGEWGKVRACLPCQKARKACVWPLGAGGAGAAMGRTEASGKPVLRRVRKRAERTVMNTSPRGGEKCKKARTTTEEGEDDDDTEEVFRVPRVMVEEQRNTLGMLTQALAQVAERMAVVEVRDEERLALERETVEIWRAHLAMVRRAADHKEERLEMDQVQLFIAQQRTEDLWKMGMLMQSPFVYLSKGKERAVETEAEAEERGEEPDDEDEDAQGEEE